MKYNKGDMLYSITGKAWYYIINRHKGIEQGKPIDCYLARRLAPPRESFLTHYKKDYLDLSTSFILVGNYPAYNWEDFMQNKDTAMLDATDQALVKAGSPIRVGTSLPVDPSLQVPTLVPPPVTKSPKIKVGTLIKPKEAPIKLKKKELGDDITCECGSYFLGVTQKGKGHSSWCPMFRE